MRSGGHRGWSSARLKEAWALANDFGSGAVTVVHGGVVVATFGAVTRKYDVFSMRKQLLSLLLGMEVARGSLDLDATQDVLGIDDVGGFTSAERRATVRDLLMSRSGVYHQDFGYLWWLYPRTPGLFGASRKQRAGP